MKTDMHVQSPRFEEIADGLEHQLGSFRTRAVLAVALLLLAALSAFPTAWHFSKPEAYQRTTERLEHSQNVATDLMLATAAASTAITVVGPGDWGDGVANEFADISGGFAIVLAAILLEKHGVAVVGSIAFGILIPIALVLLAVSLLLRRGWGVQGFMQAVAGKVLVFALALAVAIPCAVAVSGMVDDAYNVATGNKIEKAKEELDSFSLAVTEASEEQGILDKLGSTASTLFEGITKLPELVQSLVSGVLEAFAMTLAVNCIVPVLVVVLIVWMANTVLGSSIPIPKSMPRFGSKMRKRLVSTKD